MSKQVLSIEQMKYLQELGLDTDCSTFFVNVAHPNKHIFNYAAYDDLIEYYLDYFPAFTLQDILDLLPEEILKGERVYRLVIERAEGRYFISYYWCDNLLISKNEELLIDAAYKMLCWCIENGYIETNGLDKLDGSKKEKEQ